MRSRRDWGKGSDKAKTGERRGETASRDSRDKQRGEWEEEEATQRDSSRRSNGGVTDERKSLLTNSPTLLQTHYRQAYKPAYKPAYTTRQSGEYN